MTPQSRRDNLFALLAPFHLFRFLARREKTAFIRTLAAKTAALLGSPMTNEENDVAALVRRYTSVDAETGKAPRYYVSVYGGNTSSKSRKLASNVDLDDGRTPEELIQDVLRRIQTAKAESPKKLYVRAYLRGDSAPADVVIVEGEPGAAREGGEDEATSLASAHASVVMGLLGEVRWLSSQLQTGAAQYTELMQTAASTFAELQVRSEMGFSRSISDAADKVTANLAPHLGEIAKIVQALRGIPTPDGGSPAEGDHATQVRAAVGRIEADAASLGQKLAEAAAAGAMTEPLATEVRTRLSALVAAMGMAS